MAVGFRLMRVFRVEVLMLMSWPRDQGVVWRFIGSAKQAYKWQKYSKAGYNHIPVTYNRPNTYPGCSKWD